MIRFAGEEDIDALIALYEAFHEFHVRGTPDRLRIAEEYDDTELQASLKRIIANDASAFDERWNAMNVHEQPADVEERLAANIARVRAQIGEAARRVGRSPDEITLVAVSKTVSVGLVKIAYNLGVTDFGENRVQDALPKIAEFHPQGMRWHMIGHLQSNKAGKVAGAFDAVQSIDSLHLAQVLNRHAEEEGKVLPVLLQVNVAGEESKEGMAPDELLGLAHQIAALPCLKVRGLMTIAPLVDDAEKVRYVFRALRDLRERLRQDAPEGSWHDLSMGMTDDYRVAIEEGATIVRIGRAIFGERIR